MCVPLSTKERFQHGLMLRFHHFPDSSRKIGLPQMIGIVGPGYAHHGTPEKEVGDHPRSIQASVFRLNMEDSTRVFRVGIESLKHPVRLSPGRTRALLTPGPPPVVSAPRRNTEPKPGTPQGSDLLPPQPTARLPFRGAGKLRIRGTVSAPDSPVADPKKDEGSGTDPRFIRVDFRMHILVMNCGSSSVKFAVVDPENGQRRFEGHLECSREDLESTLDEAMNQIRTWTESQGEIQAVGHRVVHGGELFQNSALIDDSVIESIESISSMAPLHNPAGLSGIKRLRMAFPALPQVAVFDTAFHHTLPERAYLYAIPKALHKEHGVRRYGFHGTSHRFVAEESARRLQPKRPHSRLVTAHLGSGCSLCAVLDGRSIDTSMGLTPLEGLVMGTRSGDVDPGLHGFLADRLGLDLPGIEKLLNRESGLLGISGISGDMRELERAAEDGNQDAELALEIFAYRLARQIASMLVPLGGLDALVFTGGIGENSHGIRERTIRCLGHLGLELDDSLNRKHGIEDRGIISGPTGPAILVVPTDEECLIARDTAARLAG